MHIYAVIWEDRHREPSVHLFSGVADAIAWAKRQARYDVRNEELEEKHSDACYWAHYAEGGYIWVERKEVDEDLKGCR